MSRKRYVGTSVSRVITDDLIPSSIKQGTASSALLNTDMMESINTALTEGLASKGRNYYSYGKHSYTNGLPQGYPLTSITGAAEVETTIQDIIEEAEVVMSYSTFGDLNYYHVANTILLEDYGYDSITEELSVLTTAKGWPVTLNYKSLILTQDMLDNTSEESLRNLEGDCRVRVDAGATAIGFEINYAWTVVINNYPLPDTYESHDETLIITTDLTPTGYVVTDEYFHAQYVIGGVTKYFLYKKGTGTYPLLDDLFDGEAISAGTYYPWIHFRNNFTPITADTESEEYITSKRLAKRIGLDLDTLSDSISENPNIGDVIQAVLLFGVPPETTNPLEQKYLYEYFNNMFLGLGGEVTGLDATALIASLTIENLVKKSIVIKDAKLTTSLTNRGLYRRLVTGVIGAVGVYGSASSSFSVISMEYTEDGSTMVPVSQSVSSMLYRKQVSLTQYEEIQVLDLTCNYKVIGGYYTTGDTDDDTNIILVPLDLAIMGMFNMLDKETLYARAMHFVFNSTVVIKVEWYQEAWFRFFLNALAIVVFIFSTGEAYKVSLVLLEAGASILYVIAAFVFQVVGVPLIFKELVDVLGLENSIIVLLILSLYTGKVVFSAETLKQGLMAAEKLLMYASGLIGGISDMTKVLIEDISEDMLQFSTDMKVKMDELEKLSKEMNQSNVLNPLMLLGETPDEYYNRTVHSGNIGVRVYETVSKYVQTMLTLPEFDGFFESKEHGTT